MQDAIFSPSLEHFRPNLRRVRVGVLASGDGSNFEALYRAVEAGVLNAEIAVLVCNAPGAGVVGRARRLGVAAVEIDHRGFDRREDFDAEVAEALRRADAEWVAMAGWMRVSSSPLLEAFAGKLLNIHPSLLPSFRGAHAVRRGLEAGVRVAGCTVHQVVEELDAGPIVAQAALGVLEGESLESLKRRIQALEHVLYPRALARAISDGDG